MKSQGHLIVIASWKSQPFYYKGEGCLGALFSGSRCVLNVAGGGSDPLAGCSALLTFWAG